MFAVFCLPGHPLSWPDLSRCNSSGCGKVRHWYSLEEFYRITASISKLFGKTKTTAMKTALTRSWKDPTKDLFMVNDWNFAAILCMISGFELADLSTFPAKILDRAKKMAERLKQEGEKNRQLTNFGYSPISLPEIFAESVKNWLAMKFWKVF